MRKFYQRKILWTRRQAPACAGGPLEANGADVGEIFIRWKFNGIDLNWNFWRRKLYYGFLWTSPSLNLAVDKISS